MTQSYIQNIIRALPGKSTGALKDFTKAFYARVLEDEREGLSPQALAAIAQGLFELGKKRERDVPAIQIGTPDAEKEEWAKGCTTIDIVQNEMAFLIDSVVTEIVHQKHHINYLMHPTLRVKRTKAGIAQDYSADSEAKGEDEAHIHIQLQGVLTAFQIEALKEGLQKVLQDVDTATADWIDMREKLRKAQKTLSQAPKRFNDRDIEEYQAFLEYLYDNNFTILGYREYKFSYEGKTLKSRTARGSGLGLLRQDVTPVYINEARTGLSATQQKMRANQPPLTVAKVNKNSTVHRRVPLDAVAIKTYDDDGKVSGEILFIGLFTSVTYSRSVTDVPYLRMKVRQIMERCGFEYMSHDYKALKHILEKYPRDELFQISVENLYDHSISILQLQERPRIALYMRDDPFGRYVSCLTYIPRDRLETRLRLRFTKILESELNGTCTNYKVTQDDSPLARIIFFIDINNQNKVPKYDTAAIEQKLIEAGRLWSQRLRNALERAEIKEAAIADITQKYGEAFPGGYMEKYDSDSAVLDIAKLESLNDKNRLALDLYRPRRCAEDRTRLKIYSYDRPVPLSDILPILENMGLKVLSELPFEIKPKDHGHTLWVHDFDMEIADKTKNFILEESKERFEEALLSIWHKNMEDDKLNRLVISGDLGWRQVSVLRSYVRYLRQMRYVFSMNYIERALISHPALSKLLFDLFDAQFNPSHKDHDVKAGGVAVEIDHMMDEVHSLDFDRIFRSITTLVQNSLRTNFYQRDENGNPKPYISIKLKSPDIGELPDPKPYREIFVYSPRVEGVHLRGDVIARGGLRWSDRHEDFRTEVLGLMKAQMVKNAVIVPMGAKGGFVVKRPPEKGGPDAMREEGVACYKIFIRGLLDITDNRDGSKIIPPADVVRKDGDDPYLVVAADKGTASFSDIANSLSLEYGFWLGDAFASGGSAGYDHKEMGITARGAWESVKRHFRELNHDIQTQDFDVIGIGDMGGDVFGNGMLLSEHIRLIGAFNHIHIFCDPDPEPAKSFAERKRLFDAGKGWDAYDQKLLSKGGKIFSRADKSLALSPEIQKRFDIKSERATPGDLISAMLKARTDLLWFGGIGTYVKASDESHADVGDKGNDNLRVNAEDVRAKVIGEGANLAITQRGRIEYAKKGGKLNADFIDNSGGVDSSDHEVNIKILLSEVMRKSKYKLDLKKRNTLLKKMTENVAKRVLRHNYQQSQAISLIELNAADMLSAHAGLIRDLEKGAGLNRKIEYLPSEEDIETRLRNGKGLTRPEISVLVSYSKIQVTKALLRTDILSSKSVESWLIHYFPKELQDKYVDEIRGHRLRKEIIATMIADGMVNRMGPTFVSDRIEKSGASSAEVAKAYVIVRESFGLRDLWNKIEALDNDVPAKVQLEALHEIAQMTERAVTWFLSRLGRPLDIEEDVAAYCEGIKEVRKSLSGVVTKTLKNNIERAVAQSISNGLPKKLAEDIAMMPLLASACDIIRIALTHKIDIPVVAQAYFEMGEHFHIDWMRTQAGYLNADDSWTADALDGLIDQLYTCQAGLTVRVIQDMGAYFSKKGKGKARSAESIVDVWIDGHGHQAAALEPLFRDLRKTSKIDLSMLVIAEQRLRNLYGG